MEVSPDVTQLRRAAKAIRCVAVCAVRLGANLTNLDLKTYPNTAIFDDVLFHGFSYIEA